MTARNRRADVRIAAWQAVGESRFTATSFIVTLFMRVDIVLTDDLLALHRSGQQIIGSGLEEADLIFRSGTVNRFHPNKPMLGIGHVGVYVSPGVVIHASPHAAGRIAPSSIAWFLDADFSKYRGTRRIIADP